MLNGSCRKRWRPFLSRLAGADRLTAPTATGWRQAGRGSPAVGALLQDDVVVVDPAVVGMAQQRQIVDVGGPAQQPVLDVMGLAPDGVRAADHASLVASQQNPLLLGRDPSGLAAVVQR